MRIKKVVKAVQAIREARNEHGILSVRGNEVHITNDFFELMLDESGIKPLIVPRQTVDLPYEVSFISDNVIYYSIYTSERFEEKIGGIPNIRKLNGNRESS